jgi:hypothetical protein
VAIIYRHSDGYPEGAGTDILRFLEECAKLSDPRFTDPSYLAAKYVVFLANEFNCGYEFKGKDFVKTPKGSRLDFLSVGVMDSDPSDIEFRYVIDCGTIENKRPKVTCYPVHIDYKSGKEKREEPVEIPSPTAA